MQHKGVQNDVHIWGRLTSINVRKVVWAAQEVGVAFSRTDAGKAFGIVDTPQYRALNPNGLVPTLLDGPLVLWESNTIVRYLCASYAPDTLYPQALAKRFDAERWMDWQQTTLNRAGGGAFLQWIRTPSAQRDAGIIAQSVAAMEPLLAMLDFRFANQAYMVGDHFTMADIPIACEVHRWFGLPQPRPQWIHLERWFDAILQRPATRGVLDVPLA